MNNILDTHPLFSEGQALTAPHLNDLFEYLELQERLTRAKLIGRGIVCGLDIRLDQTTNTVFITNGTGITSSGHLITFPKPNDDGSLIKEMAFRYFTEYSDPNEEIYPSFKDDNSQPIPLYELQDTKIAGADPLGQLPEIITNYGVVLFIECFDDIAKNCVKTNCDKQGIDRIYNLRPLLIHKDHIRNIICYETSKDVPKNEATLETLINGRYQWSGLNIPRLILGDGEITTASTLMGKYADIIDEAEIEIEDFLKKSYHNFSPILKDLYLDKKSFIDHLEEKLDEIKKSVSSPCQVQYYYTFLCDLSEAYNEFINAAFDLMTDCCINMELFTKHLRLGDLTEEITCRPSLYRHQFNYAPIINNQGILKEKVLSLHYKMHLMLTCFDINIVDITTIKITPSKSLDHPLSERAIPFYYKFDNDLVKNWNPELKRQCREKENLYYHSNQYTTPVLQHIQDPLKYNISGYDFFRIEGFICQDHQVVLRELLNLRRQKNLPFDIIELKLGTSVEDLNAEVVGCHFEDLEIMCKAWREEIQCMLKTNVRNLTDYKVEEVILSKADLAVARKVAATKLTASDKTKAEASAVEVTNLVDPTIITLLEDNLLDKVIGGISIEEGSMGSYYLANYERNFEDPCVFKDQGLDAIKEEFVVLQDMPQAEFQLFYEYPMMVTSAILSFADSIKDNCVDMDILAIERQRQKILTATGFYARDINRYTASGNYNFDLQKMAQTVNTLNSMCSIEQLKVIQEEMKRRKEEIQKKKLFHEYLKSNHGIDDKSGVPKGGTFAIVYESDEDNALKEVSNKVVASFYLPYLCCSDCPPTAYIYQENPTKVVEEVTLSLKEKVFCIPKKNLGFPFEVTPSDGIVAGEGVSKLDQKYIFNPNNVELNNKVSKSITFTVNGTPANLVVKVVKTPEVKFIHQFEYVDLNGSGKIIPQLILQNEAYSPEYEYYWKVTAKLPDDPTKVILNNKKDNGETLTIPLDGIQAGIEITSTLRGKFSNSSCENTSSVKEEIPKNQVKKIEFQVFKDGKLISKPPYQFDYNDEAKIRVDASPLGVFRNNDDFKDLTPIDTINLNEKVSIGFSAFKKAPKTYNLEYQVGSISQILPIIIKTPTVVLNLRTGVADKITNITTNKRFENLIGTNSTANKKTGTLLKLMNSPKNENAVKSGNKNNAIVLSLEATTKELSLIHI